MKNIYAEWIKFRSLKFDWIIFVAVSLAAILLTVTFEVFRLLSLAENPADTAGVQAMVEEQKGGIFGIVSDIHGFLQILIAVYAIKTVCDEFQFGTMQGTVLITPDRKKVFVSKLGFAILFTVSSALIFHIIGFAYGNILQGGKLVPENIFEQLTSHIADGLLAPLLAYSFFTLFAVGIAFLVRNFAAALLITIGLSIFAHFGITIMILNVPSDFLETLSRFLLQKNFEYVYDVAPGEFAHGATMLTLWAAASLALGLFSFKKRDI
jgi:ABC-type transport system involved in multi-copper enzyme maturation permease subunit